MTTQQTIAMTKKEITLKGLTELAKIGLSLGETEYTGFCSRTESREFAKILIDLSEQYGLKFGKVKKDIKDDSGKWSVLLESVPTKQESRQILTINRKPKGIFQQTAL